MKYCAARLFLTAIFFTMFAHLNAQEKSYPSLLWRIHKGDSKPSFLFGTMHISDKKAFNFKDSLYAYLRHAEAFALEFNPDSANQIIAAYMAGEFTEAPADNYADYTTSQISDTTSYIDTAISIDVPPTAPPPIMDSLVIIDSAVGFGDGGYEPPNFIDQFKDKIRKNKEKEQTSMATFMDAFLYEMARQQDKKIFGLETLDGKGDAARALSNGLKAKRSDSLFSRWDAEFEINKIRRMYLNEDLDSIELYYKEMYEENALDIFLYRRNKEMVMNMDSIMRSQTLFAAVGAAHLPGKQGIISMLRNEGYTVEPVFSDNRIAADSMQLDLNKRSWQTIKKGEYGFQFRLPGTAKSQEAAQGRKIIYHFDIGGGTLFMTAFGKLNALERDKNLNEIVTAHLDERLGEIGGRALSKKTVELDGIKAIEAICLYADNGFYRYREIVKDNLFYIFAVSSEKKENLFTDKAEQYFSSFKLIDIPPANWAIFESPAEGFTIRFPNQPTLNDPVTGDDPNATTAVKTYSYFDVATNTSFTVSAGRALEGNQYFEGEGFFNTYTSYLNELYKEKPVFTDSVLDGCVAKFFDGKTDNGPYKGFVAKRGNTSYYVLAEYEDSIVSREGVNRFLQSFRMTAFKKPSWKLQESPAGDFKAWLPEGIVMKKQDSTAYDFKPGEAQYYGHDPYASIPYNIEVYPVSKYFWSANIDSFYNFWKGKVVNDRSDSIVHYKRIKIGNLEGREICKIKKDSRDRWMLRFLLNGSTMYILDAATPDKYADEENAKRFFESFSLNKEVLSSPVFNNSPELLFADLLSKDSATFQAAYGALDDVHFDEDDIMMLLDKAAVQYPHHERNGLSVNRKLLESARALFVESGSTALKNKVVDHIRAHYNSENKAIDSLRFNMLGMVASEKTADSYKVLAELLGQRKKTKDESYHFFAQLYDSLELTGTLYPGLLDHLQDTTVGLPLVVLTKTLIDSNLLSSDQLLSAKKGLMMLAGHALKKLRNEYFDDSYAVPDLLELLSLLKQKDCDQVITSFLKVKQVGIKKAAAVMLVKNGRSVPSSTMRSIANDVRFRAPLYIDLKKWNSEKLFPSEHQTQVAMAESYIFTAVYDEEEGDIEPGLIYIKKVDYRYKGKQRVFYIFRANYEYEGTDAGESGDESTSSQTRSYFTVAGPFDPDTTVITIDEKENISGMWYEEEFDGMKNDYFFRKYIEQRLKWQNERE